MQNKNTPTIRRQPGYTLTEFMIVIALIATATLAVLGYKAVAKGDSDTAIETSNIAIIAANLPELKAAGIYGAKDTDQLPRLIAVGAVPSTMSVIGKTVTNTWGGAVTIGSTGAGFTIGYAELPITACISMDMGMAGGSGDISTTNGTGTGIVGQVSASAATTGCSAAGNGLMWTYAS